MQPNPNYPSNQAYGQGVQQPPAGAQFADPTAAFGSPVKVRHLEGRHCVFVPVGYNPAAKGMNPTDPPRPTVTADVLVLDGGPMEFGDDLQKNLPNTQKVTVPYFASGLLIGNQEIVKALVESVGKAIVLGRVVRGTQGNRPYLLERVDPTSPVRELAAQVWSARTMGTFVNPEPVALATTPPFAQTVTPASVAAGYAYPQASPPQSYGQPSAAPSAYAAQPQPASDCPPGWDPAVWATLSPQQREQIRPTTAAAPGPNSPTGF